jgi:hypothetical protein
MKIYGSIKELVSAVFRVGVRQVTVNPPAAPAADRTITLPDATDTLVGKATTDTLTNKTFDADGTGNSITNIENADIKTGANIARNKLASGAASHVLVNDGSGVFSSEAQLAPSRGGTGVNSTATFPVSGVIVTEASSATLSNKTLLTPVIDDYFDLNEESAPSTPASGKVRVYAKTDNKLYLKDDLGTETAVGSSGSGEINAITTGSTDATGWLAGTSHTVATNTSNSPLSPITTTSIAITATSTATESSTSGGYKTFTLPTSLLSKKLKAEFYVTTSASQTWALSVYQSTTRLALTTDSSSVTNLPSGVTQKYTAYFDANTSTGYTVSLTRTAGSGTTTAYVTSVIVGPGIQPQGAVVGEPIAYTPTITNFGNGVGYLNWERSGTKIKITGTLIVGSSLPTGTISWSLPSGLTADYSTIPKGVGNSNAYQRVGIATSYVTEYFTAAIVRDNTSTTNFTFSGNGSTYPSQLDWGTNAGSITLVANDAITIDMEVPIAEWAGSGKVNLAQNDVEYAFNTSTTDASDTSSFGYGPGGARFSAVTTPRAKRVKFQTPIQSGDQIIFEVSADTGVTWLQTEQSGLLTTNSTQNTKSFGTYIDYISSTQIDIIFNTFRLANGATFGADGATWTALASGANFLWRVRKSSAGAAVGFGIADTLSSGLVPSGTYNKSTTQWTLGATGLNQQQIINGSGLRLQAPSTSCFLNFDRSGTQGWEIGSNNTGPGGTNGYYFYEGTGGKFVGGISTGGAWTLGPSSGATGSSHFMYTDRGADNAFVVQNKTTSSTPYGLLLQFPNSTANDTSSTFLVCSGNSVQRLLIYNNGNVVNSNNSYGAISDASLKENIVDATPKLDALMNVRIVNYNLISDGPSKKQLGVVAQELEQVFPGMIDETSDGFKSVKYSVFVPMLVKAIQELKAKNDELEARLAVLEGN